MNEWDPPHSLTHSTNQSTTQSTTQSTNHPTNQPTNQDAHLTLPCPTQLNYLAYLSFLSYPILSHPSQNPSQCNATQCSKILAPCIYIPFRAPHHTTPSRHHPFPHFYNISRLLLHTPLVYSISNQTKPNQTSSSSPLFFSPLAP